MAFTPHSFFVHAKRARLPMPRCLEVFETEDGLFRTTLNAERLSDTRFEVRFFSEEGAATPPSEVGGIPVVHVERAGQDGEGLYVMRLTLSAPLPAQAFVPRPAARGEISFEDALAVATERGRPVLINRIREGDGYWFFPIYEVGSLGYVVDKRSGAVTDLGSAGMGHSRDSNLDAWLWGYERGLLSSTPRDFQIDAVVDVEMTREVLRALELDAKRLETETLPIRFEKVTSFLFIGALFPDRVASFAWSVPED